MDKRTSSQEYMDKVRLAGRMEMGIDSQEYLDRVNKQDKWKCGLVRRSRQ